MNFTEYYPLALRTAPKPEAPERDLSHCLFGLTTELGEFASEVKRNVFYGKAYTPEAVAHMKEELGDILWYVPVGLRGLGLTELPPLSATAMLNIAKVCDSLENCVEMLTMWVGAYAVEFHARRYPTGSGDQQMQRALSGLVLTVDVAAHHLETSIDSLFDENIAKLRRRYPEGFSPDAAEARADKAGLGHRES